jgi:hypothetical protein
VAGLQLGKFSLGMGDRFAHQAKAQLQACILAAEQGHQVIPVWNKSHREHTTIGSQPSSVRQAAEQAVAELGWDQAYHIDADHINHSNVDGYLETSDFFTIDVAESIGAPAGAAEVDAFVASCPELVGQIEVAGIAAPLKTTDEEVKQIANKYLAAVRQAGEIYRYIVDRKEAGQFITEVSMDETDSPQTPVELLVILAALAREQVPLQTIAPKFSGRFNKGVDYVGDLQQFAREFRQDLAVIAHAVQQYGLPANLKLSVHSGSDKFSIYEPIRMALQESNAGLHIKTAGTTWLEELIGLAEADGAGLELAKLIYAKAFADRAALCAPYASVIDINPVQLPTPETVSSWSAEQYVNALRHDPTCGEFNANLRQLLHVGYKIAAKLGQQYLEMLTACEDSISRNVTTNLYDRHLKPLLVG